MIKKILMVIIIIVAIVFVFNNFIGSKHSEVFETSEELYSVMAEDILDFKKVATYKVSQPINSISYNQIINYATQEDNVAGNCLYWMTWTTKQKGDHFEITCRYKYYVSKHQYRKVCKMAKTIAKDIGILSDYGKIKVVHDYLIETNNYNIGSDGPYRALYKGQSNCNGYALSFMAIMRECGIETTYETGDNHAWNSVKLDGQWYNIDVTWDDSGVWDKEGGTRYDYFLRGNSDWSGHHHGNATAKSKYTTTEKIDAKLKNYKLMLFLRNLVGIIMIVTIIIIINNKIKKHFKNKKFESKTIPLPSNINNTNITDDDIVCGK